MSTTLSGSSPVLVLSQHDVMAVIIFLVFLALMVILQPFLLSWVYNHRKESSNSKAQGTPSSFFEIPYVMWFLVHHGIAALAMIVILILGLDSVIDKTTVAALLGSLFGYVLGSSSKNSQPQSKGQGEDSSST